MIDGKIFKKNTIFITIIFFLILSTVATLSIVQGCRNALKFSQDFSMRWFSAKIILNGENPYYMVLKNTPSEYARKLLQNQKVYFYTPELPSSLIIIIPYAFLPFDAAVKSWLITNIVAMGLLLFSIFFVLAETKTSSLNYLFVLLVSVSGTPFRNILGLGQTPIVAFSFFALSLIFTKRERWFVAGILLSLSLVKFALLLPFVFIFYVLQKKWLSLIVCGLIHTIAYISLCMLMKTSPLLFFNYIFQLSLNFFGWGGCNAWTWLANQNSEVWWLKNHLAVIFFLFMMAFILFLNLKTKIYTSVNRLGWLSLASVFALLFMSHGLHDAICLIFPLFWIMTFKDFNILRFSIGASIIYCFFIHKILYELKMRWYNDLGNINDLIAFISLCIMLYSISKLLYFKKTIQSYHQNSNLLVNLNK